MIKYMLIREPLETPNVSPLMYRVTMESDSDKFSGFISALNNYSTFIDCMNHDINKHDQYDNEFWTEPEDDDE